MPRKRYVSPHQIEMFPKEATRRLFIGLLPDAVTQSAIGQQREAWDLPREALLTKPDRLHMTMHFLDEVEESRAIELQDALAEVPMNEMCLSLRTPELWGVAVVRPDENEQLRAFHASLLSPLRRVGLCGGTKWTPHVTIARNAANAVPPAETPAVDWPVRDFALIWSRFEPVTRYDVLRRYPTQACTSISTRAPL